MNKTILGMLVFATLATPFGGKVQAATTSDCIVATIQYDNSPRMAVWCSGVGAIHYIFGTNYGSTCSGAGVDTIKVWESMLQGALLAGKKVDLDYKVTPSTCVNAKNVRAITQIRLQAN